MKVENWNMGTRINRPAPESGIHEGLGEGGSRGRSLRISWNTGKRCTRRRQGGTVGVVETEKPLMDLGDQADDVWLLKCNANSINGAGNHSEDSYRDLWNWQRISAIYDAHRDRSL